MKKNGKHYMISGKKEAIEANMDYLKNLGEICY